MTSHIHIRRDFNGSTYKYMGAGFDNKQDAKKHAKSLRKNGKLARVIKAPSWYYVKWIIYQKD